MATTNKSKKSSSTKSRQQKKKGFSKIIDRISDPNQIFKALLFFAFSFTIVLICFVGQFPSGLQVIPNQIAKIRIVADFPFSYVSNIQTERKEDLLRKQIAPVYSFDNKPLTEFISYTTEFSEQLNQLQSKLKELPTQEATPLIEELSQSYKEKTGVYLSPDDISLIIKKTDSAARKKIFSEGLIILKDISREGIFKPLEAEIGSSLNDIKGSYFYSIQIEGRKKDAKVQSEKDALRALSLNISALDVDWAVSRSIYRLLKPGIKPNLVYDTQKSSEKIQKAIQSMSAIIVEVQSGQTIIEPGSVIGPEQMEQLRAYHDFLNLTEEADFGFNVTLRERTILTLVILFTAILYTRISISSVLRSNRRLALAALVMIFHLGLVRLIFELGDTDLLGNSPIILSILPFAAPIALGPMIVTLMLGTRLATVVAALTSTFYALMLGSITSFLLIGLLSSLVGIYFCRDVRLRADVIRAGVMSGICVALSSFFIGTFNDVLFNTLAYQVVFSLIAGAMTGVIIIGVIPFLENLFKFTTNITLLELTDFNHPLLRRLQVEAPGTYHHSIMVANLAERAASEINANPLICRVTALFHDIGKLIKPEYFIENQTSGINPHLERNPSMSALVIKSHVTEGVALAKEFKLPNVIIDVIKQHHGTTIIRYFYEKALKRKRQTELPFPNVAEENYDDNITVEESTFRYDGPRPQFKESAIVSFADSIEAASRSMQKVTATSINDLVNSIFEEKFADHQMDECPITLSEISQIKKSFSFTLLNMLHSRVEYPSKESSSDNPPTEPNEISRYSSH